MNNNNELDERTRYTDLYEKLKNFLSQAQKQILYLYFIEDLSITEIANELALTRSAVFDALKKGKKKLLDLNAKLGN
ncbi:putative DNA-binding protein [Chlamydia abortus]|nr:putative DNA-binding protein [Chlamydia abortus]SGA31334.1 putative DNA-binding protein [Chlamydia abortus]SGA32990.1 putative DNA-binding protein [Chlamydia abortus]SHE15539.1 putative DNA-binding protein [Chlamydia abortus]